MSDSAVEIGQIVEILVGTPFGVQQSIDDQTILRSMEGWDSLKHLMFLMAVEKQFKVEISPEEIPTILNVGDLLAKLNA